MISELSLLHNARRSLKSVHSSGQLDAAIELLRGEDVILDVGTGNGKSLTFLLPLLLDNNDINLIVSPLTALMIDQVRNIYLKLD
jgi:superfamily II DNA helicase RecQ